VAWSETHAKEILVAEVDGQPGDELFIAREAATERKEGSDRPSVVEPVRVLEMQATDGGWAEARRLDLDDQQLRFLVASDVDNDGDIELVAASMTAGLFRIELDPLEATLIDADSAGFEHSTFVANLDGDGTPEIYVAADRQQRIRRYEWDGTEFVREEILSIAPGTITWNIDAGRF